jgi:hypothetical protein
VNLKENGNVGGLYKGINEFKNGHQLRTRFVNVEKGGLLADSHSVLSVWKQDFCQLLNVLWLISLAL